MYLFQVGKEWDPRNTNKYYTQCLFVRIAQPQHRTQVHCNKGGKGKEIRIS